MSLFSGKRIKTKCPKCKSLNFETIETFEEHIICTVENGIFPENADDHIAGEVINIFCRCHKCKHRWKPKGAKSLLDLFKKD